MRGWWSPSRVGLHLLLLVRMTVTVCQHLGVSMKSMHDNDATKTHEGETYWWLLVRIFACIRLRTHVRKHSIPPTTIHPPSRRRRHKHR